MAVINATGNSLTGATGTGNFVGANTPTLITPVLGVATATSINFGGGALGAYAPRASWSPVFTFATPGDLALSGVTSTAYYFRIGDGVFLTCDYTFTPTFTTSSGNASITGLPITQVAGSGSIRSFLTNNSVLTYPAGSTALGVQIAGSGSFVSLIGCGTASTSNVSTTSFTSGVSTVLRFEIFYYAA